MTTQPQTSQTENPHKPGITENTPEAWDKIWKDEDGIFSWRTYPRTAKSILAIINENAKRTVTPLRGQLRILELGCGVGILSSRIKRAGHRITGIDISAYAIEEMKTVFNIEGIVAKVPPIPFPDAQFDWVIAAQFLEHLSEPEADLLAKEAARVAPKAIFCVPDDALPKSECKFHEIAYTEDSLTALLGKHYPYVYIAKYRDVFAVGAGDKTGIIDLPILLAICSNEEI